MILSCFKGKQKAVFQDDEVYSEKHSFRSATRGPTDTTGSLAALRCVISDSKVDCYVVPSSDAHGSEYVAKKDRRQEYISGFTGESSMAIVSQQEAALFVDGRYHVSAGKEIDQNWTLYKVGLESVPTWSAYLQALPEGTRIGLDATLFGIAEMQSLRKELSKIGQELVLLDENLVDKIWEDRPMSSKEPLIIHVKYAGEHSSSKLTKVRAIIEEKKADAYIVQELSEIAWLLNLRGKDIPFSPVFEAYLLVTLENASLFVDRDKVKDDVSTYLMEELNMQVKPYEEVWQALAGLYSGTKACILSNNASFAIYEAVGENKAIVVSSPVGLLKSIKNEAEIEGMKSAYLRDAGAWAQWMAWMEKKMGRDYAPGFTEWDAAEKLTEYRKSRPLFAGLAYENISATGANGALPHYSTGKDTAASLGKQDVYLNDSGAQYLDGTIDTTRTYHFGRPKAEHKRAYTRVLQGHHHATEAKFPAGTTGAAIDALARAPLWKDGYNFLHGTGHGIGYYLNVHEGPQRIASYSTEPLREGQFVSIEPGYYEEGAFGIRIESIFLVKKVQTHRGFGGEDKWLGFERITQIPIDTRLVDWKLLSKEEVRWLREHNRACAIAVLPLLSTKDDRQARKWLEKYF